MDKELRLASSKRWDPSYGMLATKSTGDPMLDKVSVLMAEHNHAVQSRQTLEKMRQVLARPGTEVQMTLSLDITSGKLTPLELERNMIDENPDLKDLLDGPDGQQYRQHIQDHIQELIESGNNRHQTTLQVTFPVSPKLARDITLLAGEEAPQPNPGAAAQALRDLADKVEAG